VYLVENEMGGETITPTPFLDEVADQLRAGREFSRELNPHELEEFLEGAVSQMAKGQENLRVGLSNPAVSIREGEANVTGRIDVMGKMTIHSFTIELDGGLDMVLHLRNDPRSGGGGRILCEIKQLEGKIKSSSGDPIKEIEKSMMGLMFQKSIFGWLDQEMKERGATVHSLSLHLLPESLEIKLT